MRSEEEWTLRVARFNNLGNFGVKLLGGLCLLAEILSLQDAVEGRNNFTIDLFRVSILSRESVVGTDMITPKPTRSSELGVALW